MNNPFGVLVRRKPSPQTTRVLAEFVENPNSCLYGYELLKRTGLRPGTLYTIINRLEDQNVLTSEWAGVDLDGDTSRPHRTYKLTEEGKAFASNLIASQYKASVTDRKKGVDVTKPSDESSEENYRGYPRKVPG